MEPNLDRTIRPAKSRRVGSATEGKEKAQGASGDKVGKRGNKRKGADILTPKSSPATDITSGSGTTVVKKSKFFKHLIISGIVGGICSLLLQEGFHLTSTGAEFTASVYSDRSQNFVEKHLGDCLYKETGFIAAHFSPEQNKVVNDADSITYTCEGVGSISVKNTPENRKYSQNLHRVAERAIEQANTRDVSNHSSSYGYEFPSRMETTSGTVIPTAEGHGYEYVGAGENVQWAVGTTAYDPRQYSKGCATDMTFLSGSWYLVCDKATWVWLGKDYRLVETRTN